MSGNNGKIRIATTSLAGCFGCHMSILDIDVKILDDLSVFSGLLGIVRRVLRILVAPEHVLDQIGRTEVEEQTTLFEIGQGRSVLLNALVMDQL